MKTLVVVAKSVFVMAVTGALTALVDALTSDSPFDLRHYQRVAATGAMVGVLAYLKSSPLKPVCAAPEEKTN